MVGEWRSNLPNGYDRNGARMKPILVICIILNFVLIGLNEYNSYLIKNNHGLLHTSIYACGVFFGEEIILRKAIPDIQIDPEPEGCVKHRLNAIKNGWTASYTEGT